ncbi:unnamed protein product [Sphagnum compactum]
MEDKEGRERLRRHHRGLLPRPTQAPSMGSMAKSNGKSIQPLCEKIVLFEGRHKYVCAAVVEQSYHSPLLWSSSYSELGLLRAGRRQGVSSALANLLQVFSKGRNNVNQRDQSGVANAGILVVGGLLTVAKFAVLLLSRSLCSGAWPYLQVLSICTLPIGPLKHLELPEPIRSAAKSIAGPVLGITVAQPVVWWCLPDVYRTARFWHRLLPIYFGYMRTKRQVRKMTPPEKEKVWAVRHEWGGEKVHKLVLDMSGFYVKSAQILATKADFVPEPWIRRLSNHLDNAPPRPFPEVELSIMQQLSTCPCKSSLPVNSQGLVPLDAVFMDVDHTALAAASIAQVHTGMLKDGSRVVIKVQHFGMEKVMASDLRNIGRVAKFLEGQLPFDLGPIVKEIQATIPLEFDFLREVWFMVEIKRSLEANGFNQIVCPAPMLDLCAKRLIVMERLDGVPFTHILHPGASQELQKRIPEVVRAVEYLVHAYGQMLFVDGVFHADPHAGNLLLLADGRLGLLDFGQSKVLQNCVRIKLARMIQALANKEDGAIARALLDLGLVFEDVYGGVVSESRLATMARILFDTCYVAEATVSPMSQDSLLRTTPLRAFNQAIWMVVRTLVILRGMCFALKMDLSATAIWLPFARAALQSEDNS